MPSQAHVITFKIYHALFKYAILLSKMYIISENFTWPVLLKAQQVIGCSIGSEVLSFVRASLSQNENLPSDPTVAKVPCTG